MKVSWRIWFDEFVELDRRMHVGGEELEGEPAHRYSFLKNMIEAGLGIKKALQEDNRRAEPRIPICIPVEISWDNGEWDAFTVNMSWGGVQVEDPPPLDVGKQVNLKLVMEREGIEFTATGKVVWKEPEAMGIVFKDLMQNQLASLADILHKFIRERLEENLGEKDSMKIGNVSNI